MEEEGNGQAGGSGRGRRDGVKGDKSENNNWKTQLPCMETTRASNTSFAIQVSDMHDIMHTYTPK